MDARRFDALSRIVAGRTCRRTALIGGLGVALDGLGSRLDRPGATQDVGTPAASPAATAGLLDVLCGTPPATDDPNALARYGDADRCCKNFECWDYRLKDHQVVERFLGAYRHDPCI